jgi:hypothetical protein
MGRCLVAGIDESSNIFLISAGVVSVGSLAATFRNILRILFFNQIFWPPT